MDQEAEKEKAPFWEAAFLEAFAKTGIISKAAEIVGVSRMTVWRRRSSSEAFAKAFEDAQEQAADTLEAEAWRRAHDGVDEPQFYKGDVCGHVRKYSDNLMMFMLKGMRPEKYRERFTLAPADLDRLIERELQIARQQSTETQTEEDSDSVM